MNWGKDEPIAEEQPSGPSPVGYKSLGGDMPADQMNNVSSRRQDAAENQRNADEGRKFAKARDELRERLTKATEGQAEESRLDKQERLLAHYEVQLRVQAGAIGELTRSVEALLSSQELARAKEPVYDQGLAHLACEIVKASLAMTKDAEDPTESEKECLGTAARFLAGLFKDATPGPK